jgi:hypothetical protein
VTVSPGFHSGSSSTVSSQPSTLQSYAHLLPQSDELAAERVAALLAG